MQRPDVSIETLTPERFAGDYEVLQEFMGGKLCCCFLPLSSCESANDHARARSKWPADKLSLGAVAVVDGKVVGVVQMAMHGHPCDMHAVKPGECHIEHLAVSASARGHGVGTKLLKWCEETARARGVQYLSLAVVSGNPAKRLYERFGFRDRREDVCNHACTCLFITFFFGRPYGCCHPEWGGAVMDKPLTGGAAEVGGA